MHRLWSIFQTGPSVKTLEANTRDSYISVVELCLWHIGFSNFLQPLLLIWSLYELFARAAVIRKLSLIRDGLFKSNSLHIDLTFKMSDIVVDLSRKKCDFIVYNYFECGTTLNKLFKDAYRFWRQKPQGRVRLKMVILCKTLSDKNNFANDDRRRKCIGLNSRDIKLRESEDNWWCGLSTGVQEPQA